VLIVATLAIFFGLVLNGSGIGDPVAVAGLAATAAIAERGRVKLGGVTEASISLLPTVFAAAMFGPLAAMIVAAASFIGDFPLLLPSTRRAAIVARGAPYLKWGIYTTSRAVYGAIAGAAATAAGSFVASGVGAVAVATAVAAFT